jgi:CDP-glucose 4,6-dehydratase
MEALRSVGGSAAAVIVTTDKVYENPEEIWGRRESDPLGGHDPYSASKAAAELVAAAYRQSFFQSAAGESSIRAATVRAGNVIGGGDWAADRLVPDLARAFSAGRQAILRNPKAVRPWQHVLEPLTGYMILAERLWQEPDNALWSSAWNFGPAPDDLWPVSHIADNFALAWGLEMSWLDVSDPLAPFESSFLHLNTDKSILKLGWKPRWKTGDAVTRSALWYKGFAAAGFKAPDACLKDIQDYLTAPQ